MGEADNKYIDTVSGMHRCRKKIKLGKGIEGDGGRRYMVDRVVRESLHEEVAC